MGLWATDYTEVDGGYVKARTIVASAISSGTITANEISAGTITGNEISATAEITAGSGNNIGVLSGSDATYRMWAGHAAGASAPFSVTQGGAMLATSATITGTLNATSGYFGNAGVKATASGIVFDYSVGGDYSPVFLKVLDTAGTLAAWQWTSASYFSFEGSNRITTISSNPTTGGLDSAVLYCIGENVAVGTASARLYSSSPFGAEQSSVDTTQSLHVGGDLRVDGTTAGSATTGGVVSIPATCRGFLVINISGTDVKVPYFGM